jgi:hypothetical protein
MLHCVQHDKLCCHTNIVIPRESRDPPKRLFPHQTNSHWHPGRCLTAFSRMNYVVIPLLSSRENRGIRPSACFRTKLFHIWLLGGCFTAFSMTNYVVIPMLSSRENRGIRPRACFRIKLFHIWLLGGCFTAFSMTTLDPATLQPSYHIIMETSDMGHEYGKHHQFSRHR